MLGSDESDEQMFVSILKSYFKENIIESIPARDRFKGSMDALVLDVSSNTFSHEWPAVITVEEPSSYVSPLHKYIARTRCVVELIAVEKPDFFLGNKFSWTNIDDGMFKCNTLSVQARFHLSELGIIQTLMSRKIQSGEDRNEQNDKIRRLQTLKCLLSRCVAYLNTFHNFSKALIKELKLTGRNDSERAKLKEMIQREYYRCVCDFQSEGANDLLNNPNCRDLKQELQFSTQLLEYIGKCDDKWKYLFGKFDMT